MPVSFPLSLYSLIYTGATSLLTGHSFTPSLKLGLKTEDIHICWQIFEGLVDSIKSSPEAYVPKHPDSSPNTNTHTIRNA